jgi:hypothetical protein
MRRLPLRFLEKTSGLWVDHWPAIGNARPCDEYHWTAHQFAWILCLQHKKLWRQSADDGWDLVSRTVATLEQAIAFSLPSEP